MKSPTRYMFQLKLYMPNWWDLWINCTVLFKNYSVVFFIREDALFQRIILVYAEVQVCNIEYSCTKLSIQFISRDLQFLNTSQKKFTWLMLSYIYNQLFFIRPLNKNETMSVTTASTVTLGDASKTFFFSRPALRHESQSRFLFAKKTFISPHLKTNETCEIAFKIPHMLFWFWRCLLTIHKRYLFFIHIYINLNA